VNCQGLSVVWPGFFGEREGGTDPFPPADLDLTTPPLFFEILKFIPPPPTARFEAFCGHIRLFDLKYAKVRQMASEELLEGIVRAGRAGGLTPKKLQIGS
jgi:hypothetical protein